MKSCKHLTAAERANIEEYRRQGLSYREIAKATNASYNQVANLLQKKTFRKTKETRGGKIHFTGRQERTMTKLACRYYCTSAEIRSQLKTTASKSTIQRYLKSDLSIKYGKIFSKPNLSEVHKLSRLEWAGNYVDLGSNWKNVIFSDEKKFNLDGPDGVKKFWYEPGANRRVFQKRQNGGGNVMIWAAFSAIGKSKLCVLEGRQTAGSYIDTLETNVMPLIAKHSPESILYQQDNCPIHTAKVTKEWFSSKTINVMKWPSYSPDLNPMENIWATLAQNVYANGRQFQNRIQLIERIQFCWENLDSDILTSLVNSMKNRCVKILLNKGEFLKY